MIFDSSKISPLTAIGFGQTSSEVLSKQFNLFFCFVFVALRPMSTAMVIAGRSVHLTTLFPDQA